MSLRIKSSQESPKLLPQQLLQRRENLNFVTKSCSGTPKQRQGAVEGRRWGLQHPKLEAGRGTAGNRTAPRRLCNRSRGATHPLGSACDWRAPGGASPRWRWATRRAPARAQKAHPAEPFFRCARASGRPPRVPSRGGNSRTRACAFCLSGLMRGGGPWLQVIPPLPRSAGPMVRW